jgi:tetratricopeptide (TPR) repeat protein
MDEKLAIEYFNNQQYEKALVKFNTVYKKNPTVYYRYILDCYLELDQLTNAENFIAKSIKKNPNNAPTYYIDLGYVQLKNGKETAAEKSFSKVFQFVEERPNMAYGISTAFSKYGFYEEALETFERAERINPGLSFDYQKALVYADMGDSKNMYISYLSMLDKNASYYNSILSMLRQSVSSDPTSESNILLKELIIEKIQTTDNPLFNDLLVWVLIQEKSFSSAYIQLKALDKRLNRNQSEIYNLGGLAIANKNYSSAEKCFDYIIKVGEVSPFYTDAMVSKTFAHKEQLSDSPESTPEEYRALITELESVKAQISYPEEIIKIDRAIAEIEAYKLQNATRAIEILEDVLAKNKNKSDELGYAKILLGDITLANDDPWEALLYFSQVDKAFGDNEIGQEARFKKAMVAFYQGDFDWAKTQFDVLKAATSKLISNDAMYMSLMISDNTFLDTDTNYTALKLYAKAKLLIEREALDSALLALNFIENTYPAHSLVDDVIWERAKIQLSKGQTEESIQSLMEVVNYNGSKILADDALYLLGDIYENTYGDKEKAMEYYQRVFSEHAGSILASQARAKFRALRGDELYN